MRKTCYISGKEWQRGMRAAPNRKIMRPSITRFATCIALLAAISFSTLAHAEDEPNPSAAAMANLQVQINQLNHKTRSLRGQLEQAKYTARKSAETLRKYALDPDSRVKALEQKKAALPAPQPPHSASG